MSSVAVVARVRPVRRSVDGGLLGWLPDRDVVLARLVLIPVGFLPVSLIAATAFGVAGLRTLALRLLAPAVLVAVVAGLRAPRVLRLAVASVAVGMVATGLYDVFRFSFLAAGLMQRDPIPHIGVALGLRPAWAVGYLWRYLGNGGGLAVAFVALGLRGVRTGVLYGLFVCAGLLATLVFAPFGQTMLFPLDAATVVMAVGGHAVYGAVLGLLAERLAVA